MNEDNIINKMKEENDIQENNLSNKIMEENDRLRNNFQRVKNLVKMSKVTNKNDLNLNL